MIIIGEKINGTRKKVAQAIASRNDDYIKELARNQFKAGAFHLDVNAGTLPAREPEDLVWLIEQTHLAAPEAIICLDSANPVALSAGLEKVKSYNPSKIMVNSLSGEKNRLDGVLPLAVKYDTELIVLALDDRGIPPTVEGRMAILRDLIQRCRDRGLNDEALYADPLVMTISTDTKAALVTLEAIKAFKEEYPNCHVTCGHSNVSFGMPLRSLVNQNFMALTIYAGLDSAITDPENRELRGAIMATEALLGQDRHCLRFNKAFRAKQIGPAPAEAL
ncbi:MAG: dihydropteroate synthase [Deltaproteobacteria bacterium]|jgi:5-methyltetrahydrofolate--homocysteine methyltransferase|nr:dihydropteroate synthase [Deltaproteobacteria bacterium]